MVNSHSDHQKLRLGDLKRIFKILIVGLVNITVLEVLLRAIAFCMYSFQISNTFFGLHKPNEIRILTLGESTTAKLSGMDWPTQLEAKLKKDFNDSVKVINVAEAGTSTTYLAADLLQQIEKYDPHIVVSMMGVNDLASDNWYLQSGLVRSSNVLLNLRVVKLFKAIVASVKSGAEQNNMYDYFEVVLPEPLITAVKEKSYKKAEAQLADFLKDRDERFEIQTYRTLLYLINSILSKNFRTYEDEFFWAESQLNLFEKVEKYLIKNHWVAIHMLAPNCSSKYGNKELYKKLARHFVKYPGTKPDNVLLKRLGQCLAADDPDLQAFMKTFAPYLELTESRSLTADNYRYVYDVLDSNGICWLVLQYPLLDIKERKDYFTLEQQQNPRVRFVSNFENFAEALKVYKYDDLFIDRLGKVFGHATEKGNTIIADNVYFHLSEVFKNRYCYSGELNANK